MPGAVESIGDYARLCSKFSEFLNSLFTPHVTFGCVVRKLREAAKLAILTQHSMQSSGRVFASFSSIQGSEAALPRHAVSFLRDLAEGLHQSGCCASVFLLLPFRWPLLYP